MRYRWAVLFVSVGLCLVSTPALAQERPNSWPDMSNPAPAAKSGGEDVVVLIAPEDYVYLDPIQGSVQSARDWETFLSKSTGVDSANIFKLTGPAAAVENIESQIDAALERTSEKGKLWFIFIGHGTTVLDDSGASKGYLLGADTQQSLRSVARRGLATQDLLKRLNAGKQSKTIVILDACFSGLDSSGEQLFEGGQLGLTEAAIQNRSERTLVLTAASSTQFAGALPGGRRPAFSYLLLGALRGWVHDGNGEPVTAADALDYTKEALDHLKDRKQTPTLVGDGSLELTRGAGEAGPGVIYLMENPPELREIDPFRPARLTLTSGATLAALGGASLLTGYFLGQAAESNAADSAITQQDYVDRRNRANSMMVIGYAGLGTGAAGLILGGALWRGAKKDQEHAVRVLPSHRGVQVRVEF